MAAAFEFCLKPSVYDHLGKVNAYYSGSNGQYVGIIVLPGHGSCIAVTTGRRPDPRYFIGG